MRQVLLSILFLSVVQINYGCYITNCPIGGKRSLLFDNNVQTHQCPRCGSNGQCFGPAICCTDLACRIGHPTDIRQCALENHRLTPCEIKSSTCSTVPNGRCAANGVCCGTGSCQTDKTCLMTSIQENDNFHDERLLQPEVVLVE